MFNGYLSYNNKNSLCDFFESRIFQEQGKYNTKMYCMSVLSLPQFNISTLNIQILRPASKNKRRRRMEGPKGRRIATPNVKNKPIRKCKNAKLKNNNKAKIGQPREKTRMVLKSAVPSHYSLTKWQSCFKIIGIKYFFLNFKHLCL